MQGKLISAAVRTPEVESGDRNLLDRSKIGRFQESHHGKKEVKILRESGVWCLE